MQAVPVLPRYYWLVRLLKHRLRLKGRIDALGIACIAIALVFAVVAFTTNAGNSALQHDTWLGSPVLDCCFGFMFVGAALRIAAGLGSHFAREASPERLR